MQPSELISDWNYYQSKIKAFEKKLKKIEAMLKKCGYKIVKNAEYEADEIEETIEEFDEMEAVADKLSSEDIGLKEKLIAFDRDVIRKGKEAENKSSVTTKIMQTGSQDKTRYNLVKE